MRELIAQEEATKFHDDRMQRHVTAIDRWHIASSGEGNQAFFQLGVDLRGAGMTLSDIADILQQEAGHARHSVERRAQIKSVLATLAGSPRQSAALFSSRSPASNPLPNMVWVKD